jgi:ribosomal-protein-alanine N-acetyltransferase
MNAKDSVPIISRTVTLRYFVPEDALKVFVMSQEPGMRAWLPDQVYESEAHALEVLQYLIEKCRDPGTPSLAPYVLGVCLNDSGELIGHVGLSPVNGQTEIGYATEDRHQGKGFASQAVRAMSEWALTRFALPRVLGIVATDNVASCKVLQYAGFELIEESMGRLHGRSGLVRMYEKARQVANERGGDTAWGEGGL